MTGILDNCALVWFDTDPGRLSPAARAFIADPANDKLLSVASVWELAIKVPTGKLHLPDPVPVVVTRQLSNTLRLLPIELAHLYRLDPLPSIHRDPFDRLLVAQAIAEGAVILTPDPLIHQYPVQYIW